MFFKERFGKKFVFNIFYELFKQGDRYLEVAFRKILQVKDLNLNLCVKSQNLCKQVYQFWIGRLVKFFNLKI